MRYVVAGLVASLAVGLVVFGETKQPAQKPDAQDGAQRMMEEFQKMAAKGEQHERLAKLAGEWNATSKMFMPGAPEPMVAQGKNKNEMILDGKWLRSEYSGEAMGQPFNGLGIMGYDNTRKKYVATWVDSMSTQLTMMEGEMDQAGKVLTMKCDGYCPMNGAMVPFKYVYTFTSPDSFTFEIFSPIDGKEHKGMEIVYTRVK